MIKKNFALQAISITSQILRIDPKMLRIQKGTIVISYKQQIKRSRWVLRYLTFFLFWTPMSIGIYFLIQSIKINPKDLQYNYVAQLPSAMRKKICK